MRLSPAMTASGIGAALTLLGGLSGALADDSGLASIHEWRRVANRTCFVDHFHDGSGSGSTQRAAMSEAVRSWQDFTDLEYGSDWAAYSRSAERSASCSSTSSGFQCSVHAIPCKGSSGMMAQTQRRTVRTHKVSHASEVAK